MMITALISADPPRLVAHEAARHDFTTSTSGGGRRRARRRRARRPATSVAVDARAQLDRGAVRADVDGVAGRDRAALARRRPRARSRPPGRWNCELGDALDRRPGEERPVADAACSSPRKCSPAAAASGGGRGSAPASAPRTASRGQRGALADVAERRRRRRQRRRARRRRPTACGESSTSKRSASFAIQASSSGHGRDHGAAQALQAAFEVDVACRRARGSSSPGRTRSAQPTASPWNIVIAITRSALLGERAHAGSAAASSPETIEQADRLRIRLVARRRPRAQASATPRRSASPAGGTRRSRACRRSRARARPRRAARRRRRRPRPDQDRALGARARRRARSRLASS